MKKGIPRVHLIIASITFILFSFAGFAQSYDKDYTDGQIYFKFKDNVQVNIPVNADRTVDLDNAPFLAGIRQQFDITGMSRPFDLNNDSKLLRTFRLDFSQYDQIEEIMQELLKNTDFEYVERVPMDYIDFIPNDSLYNMTYGSSNWNWHLDVIDAVDAWNVTTGSPDINVAIVDNAVWIEHPDLANKISLSHDVTKAGNFNSNPPSGGDPTLWSHGTHCAGLAGAETNNEVGVASIGYNVSIIGIKASSDNSPENITHGYAGLQYAANNGADIISMSWGGPGFSQTNQNLITSIYNMGIVMLASAGNDNVSTLHYPSAYAHVISVASTNEDDLKSDFSNFGTSIDVCAPGGYGNNGPNGLMSTVWDETTWGYYDVYPGTSMATPLTAGLCGLILSQNPELDPDQLETILKDNCVVVDTLPGNANYVGLLGAGRIDAFATVANTPFDPVSNFTTPVTTILPGTSIQFLDKSVGVPASWSWEFEGGTPHLSSLQNPTITFSTEGVYTVYLIVTNDFGTDTETKTGYITVTSTPVPWVEFLASDENICNSEVVAFSDESLYGPTGWVWEVEPATVTFVDGTNANSQDPHIRFDAPGFYNVTLNATNANGSGSKTIENMIHVEGITLNFLEDFETGSTDNFVLSANPKAKIKVDKRDGSLGSAYCLHFQGGGQTGGWSGGPTNTTPDQAWNVNLNFQAFASNCGVDATGVDGVGLTLDLRQTYSIGTKYSWFRVMVNSTQVADVNGNMNFNPVTNTDPWETKVFDLSQFGNTQFSITFQSACYLQDKFYAEGDNVLLDNIMISNTTGTLEKPGTSAGILTYPNPVHDQLNFSASGVGGNAWLTLMNTQGQVVYSESIANYRNGESRSIALPSLNSGIYILRIAGDQGIATKKILVK
jgi:subtilisin family serine protease